MSPLEKTGQNVWIEEDIPGKEAPANGSWMSPNRTDVEPQPPRKSLTEGLGREILGGQQERMV